MVTASEPEMLIAGAGPTGLTLACGLLANGVAAQVVDKATAPAGTSRALGLQSFADGGQRRVGWLVGCDGAHSRVRQLAGVGFPGVPFAERFLLVDAHADLPLSRHAI